MIGLDTNFLLRYLLNDDPNQSSRARRILDRRLTEEEPGFISLVTMAETVWVLDRTYKFSNLEIACAIEYLLEATNLVVQNEVEVFNAMIAIRTGQGFFSDALIAALGQWAGCAATLTFDKKASRLQGFEFIS